MDEFTAIINGVAQGAGMVAVFALYLDRRLLSIEQAIIKLGDKLIPPPRVEL
jgi:hypothetical protein